MFTIARNLVSYGAGFLTAHGLLKVGQFTEAQGVEITLALIALSGTVGHAIWDKISTKWWILAAQQLPSTATPAQIQVEAADLQSKGKGNP